MKLLNTAVHKLSRIIFTALIIILSVFLILLTKPANGNLSSLTLLLSGLALPTIVVAYAVAVKNRMIQTIGVSSLVFMVAFTLLTLLVLNFRLF